MNIHHWVRDLLSASLRHPISLIGAVMVTVSSAIILTILVLDFAGLHSNPYIGVLVFIILPGLFVFGLMLIPAGVYLDRRRAPGGDVAYPIVNLNLDRHRNRLLAFVVLSFVNLVIFSAASYKGLEYMDSVEFCGTTCHTVMLPEYTAYNRSPHSRVECVACHIGPGAGWFVKSKLSGAGQLLAVAVGNYDRPVPVPIEDLRPARETCEQCHWPEKFHSDKLWVKTSYEEDEGSTELKTAMVLKIGGGSPSSGFDSGIHWHMNIANEITYVASDATREVIPFVRMRDSRGQVTDYLAEGATKPSEAEIAEKGRIMDCVDCHNRPAHIFFPPEEEADRAILSGRISRELPFVKKTAVDILTREYASRAEAAEMIPAGFETFYRENYPAIAEANGILIQGAGKELSDIYRSNVFPAMKITWGTYSNNIGHRDEGGCLRCHDGGHESESGAVIREDCDTCHTLLAVEEDPSVLADLLGE
jgi:hypothetical protein